MTEIQMIMKRREKVIDITINLAEKLHKNDNEFIDLVYNWTVKLELMSPDDDLFKGLLGFYSWAIDHDQSDHAILTTFLHDICGHCRQEVGLDPRSSTYIKFYSDLCLN